MTRKQGIPNRPDRPEDAANRLRQPSPGKGAPARSRNFSAPEAAAAPELTPPRTAIAPQQSRSELSNQDDRPVKRRSGRPPSADRNQPSDSAKSDSAKTVFWANLQRRLLDWRFITIVGLLLSGGLTVLSLAFLFKLPAVPNCPSVFWPLAPASLRLHCAQIAAGKETVKDLLEAIELVKSLPKDHPLYPEASRLMEQWATDLLDLAEKSFQEGNIQEAVSAARKVPQDASAYKLVEERVKTWEKIWAEAETIARKVEDLLRKQNWRQASLEATKLLGLENEYWQTKKYPEITQLIATTRDDITKLSQAQRAIDRGTADDLIKAVENVASINDKSYVYQDAQDMLPRLGKRLMELAEYAAERRNFDEALRIANRIPDQLKLKQDVDDFVVLVGAQSRAAKGLEVDLEDAIAQVQRIGAGRPLYDRAQRLASRWQAELTALGQLNRARQLAKSGNPSEVQQAIAEASQIDASSARYGDARKLIDEVTSQTQAAADRPILDQADQLAAAGDVASLQAAIAQAQQIQSGRSLYQQAQEKIRRWSDQIVRTQYQPTIDNADSLAESGDLESAIAQLEQIPPGTSAYDTAQAKIEKFRSRAQAEQILPRAVERASGGTPDALVEAIGLARQVPGSSPLRSQASQAVDQWSQQILDIALGQASSGDFPGAIATAQKVPSGTVAYGQAQSQISQWRRLIGQ